MFYKMLLYGVSMPHIASQSHAVMISLIRILVYPVLSFDSWAKSVSKNAQNTKKNFKRKN